MASLGPLSCGFHSPSLLSVVNKYLINHHANDPYQMPLISVCTLQLIVFGAVCIFTDSDAIHGESHVTEEMNAFGFIATEIIQRDGECAIK